MDKKERFRKVYAYLLGAGQISSQEDLAKALDAGTGTVSKAYNQGLVSDNFFKRICAAYPGVFNLEWLLTGEGDMLQAPQMAQDGFLQVMANDTKPYTQESRDGQISRLLDMIDERDAKIEALLKENAGLRAELASAGIYGKKHG